MQQVQHGQLNDSSEGYETTCVAFSEDTEAKLFYTAVRYITPDPEDKD